MSKCFHCHRTAVPGHSLCHRHIESLKASPAAPQDKAHPTPAVAVPSEEARFVYRADHPFGPNVIDRRTGKWMGMELAKEYADVVNAALATPPSLPAAQAVEGVEADAARYRWLRINSYVEVYCDSPRVDGITPEMGACKLDAAIDQAIRAAASQGDRGKA